MARLSCIERIDAASVPDGIDLIVCAHAHAFVSERARDRTRLGAIGYHPVSYTHLDVYKRQELAAYPASNLTDVEPRRPYRQNWPAPWALSLIHI